MVDKLMRYTGAGFVALTLVLTGPVSLTLALTVPRQDRIEVQRVLDRVPSLQAPLLLVQDEAPEGTVPPAADTSADAVPPTEAQEIVIEYGNWAQTFLKPIRDIGLALIPFVGLWVVGLLPGMARMFFPARRVNELLEAAWLNAFNSVDTALKGRNAKVTIVNNVLRQMAVYAIAQAPQVVKAAADNVPQLLQKLIARIPGEMVPTGWTAQDAVRAVSPASIKAAAEKQGVGKKVAAAIKDDGSFAAGSIARHLGGRL